MQAINMSSTHIPIRFDYSALDSVRAGSSVNQALPELIKQRQVSSILIVASASLAKQCEHFSELTAAILASDQTLRVEVFCGIRAHTPRQDVLEGLALAREIEADLLVSIGGGSVIDACKVIQLAMDQKVRTSAELLEYAQSSRGRGSKAGQNSYFAKPSAIRQIAVPTTLSGAEFSNNAGVLDIEHSVKEGYKAPQLCPSAIIYDPDLALLTPQWLWFSTAIRSLDHAVEGYCSKDCHPYVGGQFLAGITLLASSLPDAYANQVNTAARLSNQTGVWLACCGLGTISHGASHGIGYILGSLCGIPHGITSCLMLPAVLEWNAVINGDRQADIAIAMGNADVSAHVAVKKLIGRLGLPTSLQAAGVTQNQLQTIAELAVVHPVVKNNPRSITCADHVMEILQLAW
jgi:alcohol dehydrogenase class IV